MPKIVGADFFCDTGRMHLDLLVYETFPGAKSLNISIHQQMLLNNSKRARKSKLVTFVNFISTHSRMRSLPA